jgi:hypothetical protein
LSSWFPPAICRVAKIPPNTASQEKQAGKKKDEMKQCCGQEAVRCGRKNKRRGTKRGEGAQSEEGKGSREKRQFQIK